MRWRGPLFACLLLVLAFCGTAQAAPVPAGAEWTEEYITEPDGTRLHADVLRPKQLPKTAKTPVIVSVGPYFNHSGQTGPAGPAEGTSYEPAGEAGPSDRFLDFIEGAKLMERGYTFVMVDLRGFGGSSGCLDWAGPGEQADVKAAVEWAATRAWSTGRVGMYGKSYDGVTGLIGTALKPKGLGAVVSQEPVYDLYRYLYANRVRYTNSLLTPALYDLIAGTPGTLDDSSAYNQNSIDDLERPGCPALNWLDQQDSSHDSAYWRQRDLIAKAKGSTIPLFLTQGFLENNTKPDGAFEFFNNMKGPKRAWFGMWDHVRGNDADESGRLLMGRKGWFDEVMRFYDEHLRGVKPAVADPPVAVQSSDGGWRAERSWPASDTRATSAPLRAGTYLDDSLNNGTADGGPPNGRGVWTFSPPLARDAHLSGVPKVSVNVKTLLPGANLVVDLYDVDGQGNATLISRGASLAPATGAVDIELYGNDWKLPAGHRIGALVTSANAEWWAHVPTGQRVEVRGASLQLPFLTCRRTKAIQGDSAVKLDDYKEAAPFAVEQATIDGATAKSFPAPPALGACGL